MAISWVFPRRILIAITIAGVVAAYPLAVWGTRDMIIGALTGAGLATINVLMGFAAIEYSHGKSIHTFFKVVLGGMGIRLLVMAGLLLLLLLFIDMHTAALIWSLAFFYLVFLVMEVLYIQERVTTKQQG